MLLAPQTAYAAEFADVLWRVHGVRSITVSRSWRDRLVLEPAYPVLRSAAVSAAYVRGSRSVTDMAQVLARRHRVVAVLPHQEDVLADSIRLATLLGLPWADQDGLRVARDKHAMRELIRSREPGLRIGRSALVASPEDVAAVLADWSVDRFVLKPNDGMGNVRVAFHDVPPERTALAAYFAAVPPGGETIMEEFLGGEEFWADGQIDHAGKPQVLTVGAHRRAHIHGRENIALGTRNLARADSRYRILADYTERLMRATGLRRTPFHAELKFDDGGPALVEVNVRLVGQGSAYTDSLLSGADTHAMAVHYYLHNTHYPGPAPDYDANDHVLASRVAGVSEDDSRIVRLDGVAEVEAMPEFIRWALRPQRGEVVHRTVDLATIPWSAQMAADSEPALAAAEQRARGALRWNDAARGGRRLWDPVRAWGDKLWRSRPTMALLATLQTWGDIGGWP